MDMRFLVSIVYNLKHWTTGLVYADPENVCDVSPFQLGDLDPKQIIECGLDPTKFFSGTLSPYEIIKFITTQLAFFAYLLCLLGFLVGVINLITSAGDKSKATNGINILTNSVVAIIIVVLVENVLKIVLNILGFNYPIA